MTVDDSRPTKSLLKSTITSVGHFYEKRNQLNDALTRYSEAIINTNDISSYIDRSRVDLKIGDHYSHVDTDTALRLMEEMPQKSMILYYNAYLDKAKIFYAQGEFELALMYFHRANKIKSSQQICLEGIRKTIDILQCTICNPNVHLTITNNLIDNHEESIDKINLLNRPPIRKYYSSDSTPLKEYTDKEGNPLLNEMAKDRNLFINLYNDKQSSAGLDKAKIVAESAISAIEFKLQFHHKTECIHTEEKTTRKHLTCTPEMDRATLVHIAEQELMDLQKLSPKENNVEILYRSIKVINCLQSSENNPLDLRTRLMLAEAFRLVGQSYNEMKLFDQSFENYKQAYDILSPLNDENCLYRAIFDMGRNLMLANKYSEAIEIFHDMFKRATTDNERAFVDQYISFCYLNLNNYDQAKQYAYQALDYACQSNEELLSIEANLLLGKIYLKLKDFQRAKDYFQYARNLKDQLGDLNQLNSFDEFLSAIENHQEKLSPIIKDFNPQWISSSMQNDENKSHTIEFENKNLSHWRILTPYHQLFRT